MAIEYANSTANQWHSAMANSARTSSHRPGGRKGWMLSDDLGQPWSSVMDIHKLSRSWMITGTTWIGHLQLWASKDIKTKNLEDSNYAEVWMPLSPGMSWQFYHWTLPVLSFMYVKHVQLRCVAHCLPTENQKEAGQIGQWCFRVCKSNKPSGQPFALM